MRRLEPDVGADYDESRKKARAGGPGARPRVTPGTGLRALCLLGFVLWILLRAARLEAGLQDLQAAYVERGYGMFVHFGPTTYSGEGKNHSGRYDAEAVASFAPSDLDVLQWARVAQESGMRYGVLTAKHHDGFALWPSRVSPFEVGATAWYSREVRAGRPGDVLRRYADAFRARGLAVGLYYSVWDRLNRIDWDSQRTREEQTAFVRAQLTELLGVPGNRPYGEVVVLWTDGWGWRFPEYRSGPLFEAIRAHIRNISPQTLLLENHHLRHLAYTDIVGYEGGVDGFPPQGNRLPAEVCQSVLEGGWWYTREARLRLPEDVAAAMRKARDSHAAFLLNVTPDTRGKIPADQVRLLGETARRMKK